jgi:hypothetical protein
MVDPLGRELRSAAEALARKLEGVGIALTRDREGVVAIDAYVEHNRDLWSAADRERLAQDIGAFVGECMVATYGLCWSAPPGVTPGLALPFGGRVSPLERASAAVAPGSIQRLTALFDETGAAIARGDR